MRLLNIDTDTDMIIPKQFLKTIARTSLGKNLFDVMRYTQDGAEIPDFVLNQPAYRQAETEGLAQIFIDAGFEWRLAGCSMCLAMNPDQLAPGERCAATSNRNFEGRQGRGGRTHLLSPAMAAAAAITGHLTDVREMLGGTVPA